jgi:hypothetical protein
MTDAGKLVLGVSIGRRAVGIQRFEGDILVFGPVDAGGGPVLDHESPLSCSVEGRTVVAGLLPAGAVRAVAIDASGREYQGTARDGLYVIEAGREGLWQDLVRFEDRNGQLVARALPSGRRVPVADAPEPCPLCAEGAWVEIEDEVYCSRCGLPLGEVDSEDQWDDDAGPEPADQRDRLPERRSFLAGLPYPIYSAGGDPVRAWFASVGGQWPAEVTVQSGRLHVASGPAPLRDLRWQLAMALRNPDPPLGRSAAARRVYEDHQERAALSVVARAGEPQPRTFRVDGRRIPFSLLAAQDAWAAAGECDGVFVTVWARALEPDAIALHRLELDS